MNNYCSPEERASHRPLAALKKTLTRRILPFLMITGLATGAGALKASANPTPAFNNLTGQDYPTLQVSNGSAWATSTGSAQGATLSLLVWVHNTVVGSTATNVLAKVALPATAAANQTVTASVSADNATAANGSIAINLPAEGLVNYVPGSAVLMHNVNGSMTAVNWPAGVNPDSVVTTGVNLGNQDGCWQYAQAVQLQIRIDGTHPAISTNKRVELAGGAQPFDLTATAAPGDVVNYKIYLENVGNGTGVHPKIIDTLDSHLTYVPNSSYALIKQNNTDFRVDLLDSKMAFNGQTITWSFLDMPNRPDAAMYLIFQAKLTDKTTFPIGTSTINNQATAQFDNVSAQTNNTVVTVNRSADPVVSFVLRKEVTNLTLGDSKWYDQQLASAGPGDMVAYRLIANNTGNVDSGPVVLKDILPAGATFKGSVMLYNTQYPNGLALDSSIVNAGYTFANIAPGNANAQTIIFNAQLTGNCSGNQTVVNNAQVIYQGVVKAQDDATVVFSCTRGLIISKNILDPADNTFKPQIGTVHESQTLTYRINVQNNGNVLVTNPVLRDIMPQQVTYVQNSLSIDGEFMNATVQDAFFKQGMVLTNLPPGMGKVIVFQMKVVDCPPLGSTNLVNTAAVKADSLTEITSSASATLQVNVPTLIKL